MVDVKPTMLQQMIDLNKEIIQKQALLCDYVLSLAEVNPEHYKIYRDTMEAWIKGMETNAQEFTPGNKEADIV